MGPDLGERAIVLGASMSGLLAARVLADRFATVVVVERDHLPAGSNQRRGVPQGRHLHALLAGGLQAFEQLLPGVTGDLATVGAPVGDALADMRLCFNGHHFRRAPSGLPLVSASRSLLEHHVRNRIFSRPTVTLLDSCDVVGLTGRARQTTGVRVLRRADDSAEETIDADFVVDATGRGSRAPVWLSDLGYASPAEDQIKVDLGYATRRYRLPSDALDGCLGVLHTPTPIHPRGAGLARLEDGVWMLTLIGLRGDHPPTRVDAFHRFAKSVDSDAIYPLIREAEPIDDPIAFRFPATTRRYYERTRLPDNMVVVGDSLCSFNPVYGQGMSVAALEARKLGEHLTAMRIPSSRVVMNDLARIVDVPWQMTSAVDRAFLASSDPRGVADRLTARYVDRIQAAAVHDPVVGRGFLRVSGLIDPPPRLFRPSLIWRTLRPAPRHHTGLDDPDSTRQAPAGSSRGSTPF